MKTRIVESKEVPYKPEQGHYFIVEDCPSKVMLALDPTSSAFIGKENCMYPHVNLSSETTDFWYRAYRGRFIRLKLISVDPDGTLVFEYWK